MLANTSPAKDSQKLLEMACQGNADAIAAILTAYCKYRKIKHTEVQVRWKDNNLFILCESEAGAEPPKQGIAYLLEELLQRLGIHNAKQITLYGRIRGQTKPLWSVALKITPKPSTSDLEKWSNQGDQLSTQLHILSAIEQGKANLENNPKNRFLRFNLEPERKENGFSSNSSLLNRSGTALLPLEKIQEVLKIPRTAILSIPGMAACVLGIYNHRSNLLWVVDLTQQLDDHSFLSTQPNYQTLSTLVVCRDDGALVGMVVPKILDIESYTVEQFEIPNVSLFPEPLLPFIEHYLPHSLSPILNVQALIQDPKLQHLQSV